LSHIGKKLHRAKPIASIKLQVHNLSKPRKATKGDRDDDQETSCSSPQPIQVKKSHYGRTNTKMPYLVKAIPGQAARKSIYGNQEEHVVLAIDPGIKNSATGVTVDSTNPSVAWNLDLPLGCHAWNTTNYTKLLNRLKKERGINELEAKIIPFRCPNPSEVGPAEQFKYLKESFHRHAVSMMTVEKELRAFYGSQELKVATHRRKRGGRAETDRAVEGMIRPALEAAAAGSRRATVVVGDAEFTRRNGGSIKAKQIYFHVANQGMDALKV